MKRLSWNSLLVGVSLVAVCGHTQARGEQISNAGYQLQISQTEDGIDICLTDKTLGELWIAGRYFYYAKTQDQAVSRRLESVAVQGGDDSIVITGKLAGLAVRQVFTLPADKAFLNEYLYLANTTEETISLADLETGLQKRVSNATGDLLAEVVEDRLLAIPLRRRPDDDQGQVNEFSVASLINAEGWEYVPHTMWPPKRMPSRHRFSEGWAWLHDAHAFCVFKFNQEHMCYSVVTPHKSTHGDNLRFGGTCMISGNPSALAQIAPGQTIDLGVTTYRTVAGGCNEALYAFRDFLDENGCRFSANFNPPVHWNQLYNMKGAWYHRPEQYTRARIEQEAALAQAYHCESLYLDPGWDTTFGSFIWGEQWLGPRQRFVADMKSQYGLKVSLHCPMPPWASTSGLLLGPLSLPDWPDEALRKRLDVPTDGASATTDAPKQQLEAGPALCMGSRQFLDEAEERLCANCADGVCFLMFDGTWWNGDCVDPSHGHPIPYRCEDHMRTCVELARRVHSKYPDVLIEMHDMLSGGSRLRKTPVYYKYGLPGSYDENWGFELMWDPMARLRDGSAKALYYYSMGCNIPLYLHVDLKTDNEYGIVFWWNASTCRHLGIGGTHSNPQIVAMHKQAMKTYRRLETFFKRGEFYGINEGIHLHVLPEEDALAINIFNLSDQKKLVQGQIELRLVRLSNITALSSEVDWVSLSGHTLKVAKEMAPWSCDVAVVD